MTLTYARVRVRAWLATGVFTSWPFGGLPYPPRVNNARIKSVSQTSGVHDFYACYK